MARFVLQPCRIRADRFVPATPDEPVELDWQTLCQHLAPSQSREGLMNLRNLRPGYYVGLLTTRTGQLGNFICMNPDRTGNFHWLTRKDPELAGRIQKVYRVECAEYDHTFEEMP